MKPLSQMTREELWALDIANARKLYMKHMNVGLSNVMKVEPFDIYGRLNSIRIQLQQSAAEARHDTQNER